jgi:hypothetical protein
MITDRGDVWRKGLWDKFYTSAPKQQRHKKLAKKYSVTPNAVAKCGQRL